MKEEIEVKILDIDENTVVKKLLTLGAKKIFEGNLDTIYFDTLDRSLKANGNTLRLRADGVKNVLCMKVKKPSETVKVADEHEVIVGDVATMTQILEKLGYTRYASETKRRVSYSIGDSAVDINEYLGIPTFLEVESPDEKSLFNVVKLLGFSPKDTNTMTGGELLRHYSTKRPK